MSKYWHSGSEIELVRVALCAQPSVNFFLRQRLRASISSAASIDNRHQAKEELFLSQLIANLDRGLTARPRAAISSLDARFAGFRKGRREAERR
jgi:hypothetical protein